MLKLGILYPPTGSEYEYYLAAESLRPRARAYVVGVRIAGGQREHEPRYLRRTASIDNLLLSADALAPVRPHAVMWACTSGSFIDGLGFARQQVRSLSRRLKTPCSSTSLAFVNALKHLQIDKTALLSSYPARTARAFAGMLHEAGIDVADYCALAAMSGPEAARLGARRLSTAAGRLKVPTGGALLIPDTAIAALPLIQTLERRLGCVVLTANQVTLWECLRLAGGRLEQKHLGRLFRQEG